MDRPGYAAPLLAVAVALTACGGDAPPPGATAEFVGSAACQECHQDIYERWQGTLMANVVTDPAVRPEVVVGDFSTPDPLVTFGIDQVAFTYGTKWKQRYFTRIDEDYYVFPAQWDVQARVWRRYFPEPGTEWWTEHYPADAMGRPTGPLCDGATR